MDPVRVAVAHNRYQRPGGEDQVFAAECDLLAARGHMAIRYTVDNSEVAAMPHAALAKATLWNSDQYSKLRALFQETRPAVVHVHNTLPLISPAVYYAARAEGAAVVQTLHNYRFSCVNGLFFRDGRVCEDCLGRTVTWPGILHACYRGSRAASGTVAAMLTYHKLRGTYHQKVDQYIALTDFSRAKFIEMGLPEAKITVKPNFVAPDPGLGAGDGGYALYVGRLSEEKGVRTLVTAWKNLGAKIPLKVVGSGPVASELGAAEVVGVEYLGQVPRDDVLQLMQGASIVVFPSLWYEGFPMTIVEAFATGTPVVASRIGNPAAIVDHGRTGVHFEPGNAEDLVTQVEWLLDHPAELTRMRAEARAEYEAKYTAEVNYAQLMAIYEKAIRVAR